MIRVFFTNLGWYSDKKFYTIETAFEYVKEKCYEANFIKNDKIIGFWTFSDGLVIKENE